MTATKIRRAFISVAPLILMLALWEWYAGSSSSRVFFFSTPSLVWAAIIEDLRSGALLRHTAITGLEALVGFVAGNVLGAALGIGLWCNQSVARVARPYLHALGAAPVFALGPMTIIWFGVQLEAKMALATLATIFLAAGQAYRGADQADPLLQRRLQVFGATRWTVFRVLLLPSALVWVIEGWRITIGLALMGAFIGEFIAADRGLGYMILRAGGLYDTARVLEGILAIVVLALLMSAGVAFLERRLLRWKVREA